MINSFTCPPQFDFPTNIFPLLDGFSQYQTEKDISCKREFVKDFFFDVLLYHSYDSNPPTGAESGDFVVVPIPISNPKLEEGLIVGAAYFYPESEEEKKLQPASLTAAAGMYTSNDSRAFALVQQNYWRNNKWRFTGVVGGILARLIDAEQRIETATTMSDFDTGSDVRSMRFSATKQSAATRPISPTLPPFAPIIS